MADRETELCYQSGMQTVYGRDKRPGRRADEETYYTIKKRDLDIEYATAMYAVADFVYAQIQPEPETHQLGIFGVLPIDKGYDR